MGAKPKTCFPSFLDKVVKDAAGNADNRLLVSILFSGHHVKYYRLSQRYIYALPRPTPPPSSSLPRRPPLRKTKQQPHGLAETEKLALAVLGGEEGITKTGEAAGMADLLLEDLDMYLQESSWQSLDRLVCVCGHVCV